MYQVDNSAGETNFEVNLRWKKASRTYLRTVSLTKNSLGSLSSINEGPLMVVDNLALMDVHAETETSAVLSVNSEGDQYLTVNTSNAKTSCTLNLNMYSNIHGKVYTSGVFANFQFSPDGK